MEPRRECRFSTCLVPSPSSVLPVLKAESSAVLVSLVTSLSRPLTPGPPRLSVTCQRHLYPSRPPLLPPSSPVPYHSRLWGKVPRTTFLPARGPDADPSTTLRSRERRYPSVCATGHIVTSLVPLTPPPLSFRRPEYRTSTPPLPLCRVFVLVPENRSHSVPRTHDHRTQTPLSPRLLDRPHTPESPRGPAPRVERPS